MFDTHTFTTENAMLKFSPANAKTKALYLHPEVYPFLAGRRKVYSLDLPAGHSCPGAKLCLSRAVPRTDTAGRFRIDDGRYCQFRCFSASQEVQYPCVRRMRRHNFDVLRKTRGWKQCRDILVASLPADAGVIRYHVAGDFFKLAYLRGAIELATMRPDVLFYTYTKSLPLLVGLDLPNNFLVTASKGGKYDHLIEGLAIREAVVIHSEAEATRLGLEIDHDDSHAATYGDSFALLIHGTQPAGSDAAKALQALKGKGSYARK